MSNNSRLSSFSVARRFLFILLSLVLIPPSLWAATIYVSPTGVGDGLSAGNPAALQIALTYAQGNGQHDLIRVAQGTYNGNFTYLPIAGENFDLTLEGGWNSSFTARTLDPSNTTLNGTDSGRVLSLLASNATTGNIKVEGFSMIDGRVTTDANYGGGLLARTNSPGVVTVNRNIFDDNFAETRGGGVALDSGASITLSNNIIRNNTSGPDTGGNLNLPFAGGAYVICSALCSIVNNLIYDNISDDSIDGGGGGKGGGIMVMGSGEIYIVNNTVTGNQGFTYGGGIYLGGGGTTSHFYLYNNIIRGNSFLTGYGGWLGDRDIMNGITSTVAGNSLNVANSNYQYLGSWPFTTITPNILPSNINLDPQFAGAADYRLSATSPCIDQGSNAPPGGLPLSDLEGRSRILVGHEGGTSTVDMGAFEYVRIKLNLPVIVK